MWEFRQKAVTLVENNKETKNNKLLFKLQITIQITVAIMMVSEN